MLDYLCLQSRLLLLYTFDNQIIYVMKNTKINIDLLAVGFSLWMVTLWIFARWISRFFWRNVFHWPCSFGELMIRRSFICTDVLKSSMFFHIHTDELEHLSVYLIKCHWCSVRKENVNILILEQSAASRESSHIVLYVLWCLGLSGKCLWTLDGFSLALVPLCPWRYRAALLVFMSNV